MYSIQRIEEGLEIITGVPAGEPAADGQYPPDSVYGLAMAQLLAFTEKAEEDQGEKREENGNAGNGDG